MLKRRIETIRVAFTRLPLTACLILSLLVPGAWTPAAMAQWKPASPSMTHQKKGFCFTLRHADWATRVKALRVSWVYTWGFDQPKVVPNGVTFVPMIWGPGKLRTGLETVSKHLRDHPDAYPLLLAFNEPDQKKQSHMSVEEALKLWPQLEATGLPLSSPACAHRNGKWIKQFMKEAQQRGYRVDYLCVHWYGPPHPKRFLQSLKHLHKLYHRPLLITEFAVADWSAGKGKHSNRYSPEQVLQFMKSVLPAMDRMPYVRGYAWYSSPTPSPALVNSVLFDGNGDLTPLGKFYADH